MKMLRKAFNSAKSLTNRAFKVSGNNGLYIALGILVVVLLIIIIPSAVAAHASNALTTTQILNSALTTTQILNSNALTTTQILNSALTTTQILNSDKIYLTYDGKYLSVSSTNEWELTNTPRVLQIELQDEIGVTYTTGEPILTKMYFHLKDVTTGTYATVATIPGGTTCAYLWTSTPTRFFLGGTDTNSLDSVADLAIMSGDSLAFTSISTGFYVVCGEGYSIYNTGSAFTYSGTNKLWQVSKVA